MVPRLRPRLDRRVPSLTVGVFQPSEFLNKISTDHSCFLSHRSKLNYLSWKYIKRDLLLCCWHTFCYAELVLGFQSYPGLIDDADTISALRSWSSAACHIERKAVFVMLGHNASESSNGSPANLYCFSWLKCTMGVLSFTNNAVFCRSRPRKPWQQTFSEVFGTRWKILWFIPFRQRQPLRVPYHFANHV